MLLINGLSKFPIKDNPVFCNGPKRLPKSPPIVLFYVAEELFPRALQSLKLVLLVHNNLCRKLFSSLQSPTTLDKIFKITSVPFCIPGFNLLSSELDNSTFKTFHVKSHFILILY